MPTRALSTAFSLDYSEGQTSLGHVRDVIGEWQGKIDVTEGRISTYSMVAKWGTPYGSSTCMAYHNVERNEPNVKEYGMVR